MRLSPAISKSHQNNKATPMIHYRLLHYRLLPATAYSPFEGLTGNCLFKIGKDVHLIQGLCHVTLERYFLFFSKRGICKIQLNKPAQSI